MKKQSKLLMVIFFLLSILFMGLLFIVSIYYFKDYKNLVDNSLSGIELLLFDFLYVICFLPISVLGLISSLLCSKFSISKRINIISYIESFVFILGIVFSGVLYFA